MKKRTTRILVLVLCLALFCSTAMASSLKLNYADSMNMTADEWFSSEDNRAKLTLLIMFDLWQQNIIPSIESYDVFESMVCHPKSSDLVVFIFGEKDTLMVMYTPSSVMPMAAYSFLDKSTTNKMKQELGDSFGEIQINTKESIMNATTELSSIMQ